MRAWLWGMPCGRARRGQAVGHLPTACPQCYDAAVLTLGLAGGPRYRRHSGPKGHLTRIGAAIRGVRAHVRDAFISARRVAAHGISSWWAHGATRARPGVSGCLLAVPVPPAATREREADVSRKAEVKREDRRVLRPRGREGRAPRRSHAHVRRVHGAFLQRPARPRPAPAPGDSGRRGACGGRAQRYRPPLKPGGQNRRARRPRGRLQGRPARHRGADRQGEGRPSPRALLLRPHRRAHGRAGQEVRLRPDEGLHGDLHNAGGRVWPGTARL